MPQNTLEDQRHQIVIDGTRFSSLDEFYDVVSEKLELYDWFGRNLGAFDDVLSGGCGDFPIHEPTEITWVNSGLSKNRLRVKEASPFPKTLHHSPAISYHEVTLFDILVDIIQGHDHISLVLK